MSGSTSNLWRPLWWPSCHFVNVFMSSFFSSFYKTPLKFSLRRHFSPLYPSLSLGFQHLMTPYSTYKKRFPPLRCSSLYPFLHLDISLSSPSLDFHSTSSWFFPFFVSVHSFSPTILTLSSYPPSPTLSPLSLHFPAVCVPRYCPLPICLINNHASSACVYVRMRAQAMH